MVHVPASEGGSQKEVSDLGDFKQLSRLGEGAFSVVYKVLRLADRAIYALKMVKLPSLKEKEKQNALNEVRLLASLQHENIIAYHQAFFDDKSRCLCIVTEYADGGDLFQQITKCQKEKTRIGEADVWRFLFGMCHGLKALHDLKILHRDLKCANVFLHSTRDGPIAKLGDFNVSKVAKRGLCLTQTGTPYYASPEVWRDMPYDAKSDMWSIGCVLYEMLALRPPFHAEDMEALYRKVLKGQYPRIPQQYGQDLAEVVASLLQVNPRNRPSVDQLLQMPVMRRHASSVGQPQEGNGNVMDLLQTIKLPQNALDLNDCLPKPCYNFPASVRVEASREVPTSQGGGAGQGGLGSGGAPLASETGRLATGDGASTRQAQRSRAPLAGSSSQVLPSRGAGVGAEAGGARRYSQDGGLAPTHEDGAPDIRGQSAVNAHVDSLDAYLDQAQRAPPPPMRQPPVQQQQMLREEDAASSMHRPRLGGAYASPAPGARGSPAPSGVGVRQRGGSYRQAGAARGTPQGIAPSESVALLGGIEDGGASQPGAPPTASRPRPLADRNERRPMADYARQQYSQPQYAQVVRPAEEPPSRSRGLRLPRIFG